MIYTFPYIENITHVLPYIEGRDEFVVSAKDRYTVINYNVSFEDTFPPVKSIGDAIRRECRGIIFCNSTGNVIARRYHKFFNLNERPETTLKDMENFGSHVIMEKLDGSMVTPFITNDGVMRWGTKMGETDVSKPISKFLDDNPRYIEYSKIMISEGYTPIFEWCTRQQRIVLDYPIDRLVQHSGRG